MHEDLLLVKARSSRLPQVCILTGETADLIRHRVRCRFRRFMFVPFGGPCTLTVFVSPSVQKRWRLQRLLLQSSIWIAIALLLLLESFLGIDLPTSWLLAIWLPTLTWIANTPSELRSSSGTKGRISTGCGASVRSNCCGLLRRSRRHLRTDHGSSSFSTFGKHVRLRPE